ncbi:30S ribosomal protein S5 [Candidatus Peregrinibacteria bacterium]|nr:30S ribosomal protein S5 [Candidatus Peregrinibacteria bacterium]
MGKPAHKNRRRRRKEPKEFDEEVIQIDRVTRVVKGGRRLRFRATVVIGDRKGRIGIGIGKSTEVAGAIKKAISKAKNAVIRVPIFRDTIPHDIKIKFKASRILMLPAGEGTGIIAGGAVRKVVELAGIKNILSKSFGTNNRVSNTQATYKALGLLRKRTDNRKKQTTNTKESKQNNENKKNDKKSDNKKKEVKKTQSKDKKK